MIPYRQYPNTSVHRGFFDEYSSISDGLLAYVGQLMSERPHAPVTIIGHSLGGALATICAAELSIIFSGKINLSLWALESPRVGNKAS